MKRQKISYVENTSCIDIRFMNPVDGATFVYLNPEGVRIPVTWINCNLGGRRAYFRCPDCGRRCLRLYTTMCRECRNLRYRSKSESPNDRAIRRAIRHREKFGQHEGGLTVPFPPKPANMTWKKYFEGWGKADRLDALALGAFKLPEPVQKQSKKRPAPKKQ